MKFDCYLGEDPGQKGASALIDNDNNVLGIFKNSECFTKNKLDFEKYRNQRMLKEDLLFGRGESFGCVEDVHSMPKQGVKSTFAFGFNHGIFFAVTLDCVDHVVLVDPRTWKKRFRLTNNKALSVRLANSLFKLNIDEKNEQDQGVAEALLLAYLGKEYAQYEYLHHLNNIKKGKKKNVSK